MRDQEDYYEAVEIRHRIDQGEEEVYSLEETKKMLGMTKMIESKVWHFKVSKKALTQFKQIYRRIYDFLEEEHWASADPDTGGSLLIEDSDDFICFYIEDYRLVFNFLPQEKIIYILMIKPYQQL